MARTSTGLWFGVVVSWALAATGSNAQAPLFKDVASPEVAAPARPALVHSTLNSGIDYYRRGDYELAATYFQRAQQSQQELTPTQRQD